MCCGAHRPGVMSAGPGGEFETQPGRGTDSVPTVLGTEGAAGGGCRALTLGPPPNPPRHFAHLKKRVSLCRALLGALDEMGSESEFSSL